MFQRPATELTTSEQEVNAWYAAHALASEKRKRLLGNPLYVLVQHKEDVAVVTFVGSSGCHSRRVLFQHIPQLANYLIHIDIRNGNRDPMEFVHIKDEVNEIFQFFIAARRREAGKALRRPSSMLGRSSVFYPRRQSFL